MGCCCGGNDAVKKGKLGITPYSKRGCTDILPLLVFLCFWVLTVGVVYLAYQWGDVDKLVRGTDMLGRVCGRDAGVENKSYAAWPWPQDYQAMICVESCSETMTSKEMSVWVPSQRVLWYCIPGLDRITEVAKGISNGSTDDMSFAMPVTIPPEIEKYVSGAMAAFSSIQETYDVVIGSALLALLVCVLWIFLFRFLAGLITWVLLSSMLFLGIFGGYVLYSQALGCNFIADPLCGLQSIAAAIPNSTINLGNLSIAGFNLGAAVGFDANKTITFDGSDVSAYVDRLATSIPNPCSCQSDPLGASCDAAYTQTCNQKDPAPSFCDVCSFMSSELNSSVFLYPMADSNTANCLEQSQYYAQAVYAPDCTSTTGSLVLSALGGIYTPTSKELLISSYVIWALTGVFLLVLLFLRKRINIAVEVIKEASRAFVDQLTLIAYPIVPLIFLITYVVAWLGAFVVIYSVEGTNVTTVETSESLRWNMNAVPFSRNGHPASFNVTSFDKTYEPVLVVHFFGLLWNIQVILFASYMVVAGAIAEWYFTPRGAAKRAIEKAVKNGGGTEWSKRALEVNDSCCPLLSSTGRVLRFHMGTVAVAAFVVAVVQFIRFVLLYIMAKREQAGEVSRVEKALFACLNCCVACLEKCLEKISKNSLIWCAIYGDNFCSSCVSSFTLVWANMARLAALNLVSWFLLLLSKIVSACAVAVAALVIIQKNYVATGIISSPFAPVLCCGIIGLLVAHLCLGVLQVCIDTIFICFLVDCEENDVGTMLASPGLQRVINKYQAPGKEMSDVGGGNKVSPEAAATAK